jgi:hypothetical protein
MGFSFCSDIPIRLCFLVEQPMLRMDLLPQPNLWGSSTLFGSDSAGLSLLLG